MNKEAIFSDGTGLFVNPAEPKSGERVSIRLRCAHLDAIEAYLCSGNIRTRMQFEMIGRGFDYYRSIVNLTDAPFSYYFEIRSGGEVVYFDRYGLTNEIRRQYQFTIVPDFCVPEWAKGAVMYQILVDRFANGDETNDVTNNEYFYISQPVEKVDDWDKAPSAFDVCRFYGGDLEGVRQKLYYLKSLGVEVIYFNPLFVSPSNHKYDTQDYDYIDPHYGKIVYDGGEELRSGDTKNRNATRYIRRVTDKRNLEASNEFFIDFVREAHEKGIRVILDGVFNHCGSFNKWLDREGLYEGQEGYEAGAFVSPDSPYHDFFRFHDGGKWPYNDHYDGWWGHDTLPKLNYEGSEELCEYILSIAKKWVSAPYNCDGWRLDVAADLGHSPEFNHSFWRRFRAAVKEANPDAVILAEHYGDASSWLMSGDQWDTIMNYDAFMEPVSYFMTGMEKHSDRFDGGALGDGGRFEMTMRHCMTEFLSPSLHIAMNQLSNHDHSRFLTRTNHKAGRVAELGSAAAGEGVNYGTFRASVVLLMTWPGAPTLYYGDEAGVVGFTDPDSRRTYPWGHADYDLIDFHRDVIFMHRSNAALKTGSFMFLMTGHNFICYARFDDRQKIIVAINSGGERLYLNIPVWRAEVPQNAKLRQIFSTTEKGYSIMPVSYQAREGMLEFELAPFASSVFEYHFVI